MAFYTFMLLLLLIRGPHCKQYTWFGYEGGLEARKSVVEERKRLEEEKKLESSFPPSEKKVDEENVIEKKKDGDVSARTGDVETGNVQQET